MTLALPHNPRFEAFIAPARHPRIPSAVPLCFMLALYLGTDALGVRLWDWMTVWDPAATDRIIFARVEIAWLLAIAAEMLVIFLIVAMIHERHPSTLFAAPHQAPPRRGDFWRAIVGGGIVALVFWTAPSAAWLLALGAASGFAFQPLIDNAAIYIPATLAAAALQSTSEEVMFRGYLLQQLAARWRSPLVWAAAPSLLFGLMHYDPWLPLEGRVAYVATMTIFGLVCAYATWRTGALGVAIGLHIGSNWLFFLVFGAVDESPVALFVAPASYDLTMIPWELAFAAAIILALEGPGSPLRRALGLMPVARQGDPSDASDARRVDK